MPAGEVVELCDLMEAKLNAHQRFHAAKTHYKTHQEKLLRRLSPTRGNFRRSATLVVGR
jgi:hypothetical protein